MIRPDTIHAAILPAHAATPARSLKVLVVGEESAGMELVRALASGPHHVVGVMTSPGVSREQIGSLWGAAQQLGLPTWPAERVKDPAFAHEIRERKVDVLLNVHSLHIVHHDCLAAPRLGSFNLHPGPLPQYAGLNCVSWALHQGERRYGVTLHRMAPDIDAGAIAGQSLFDIDAGDSALTLTLKCVKAGLPLIHQLLRSAAETDSIPTTEQDLSARHYYGKDVPDQGWLVWTRSARAAVNLVRACDYAPFRSPWGHARAMLEGAEIGILKASLPNEPTTDRAGTVGARLGEAVRVACGDEWIGVSRVFAAGAFREAPDVLRPGMRLEGSTHGRTMPVERATLLAPDPRQRTGAPAGEDGVGDGADVRRQVARLFAEQLNLEVPAFGTDLLAGGILDSLKFVELLVQLEQRFGTRVNLSEFEPDHFRSIDRIAEFVIRHSSRPAAD